MIYKLSLSLNYLYEIDAISACFFFSFVKKSNQIFRNEAQSPQPNTDLKRELGEYSNFFCNQTTGLFSVSKEETAASLIYKLFSLRNAGVIKY